MNLKRIQPVDDFYLFERPGTPRTWGSVIEMERLQYDKFKNWVRTVFVEKYPMAKAKIT